MHETYERSKLMVTIHPDPSPMNPRDSDFQDNMGIMICSHRQYELGDEQFNPADYKDWKELEQELYKKGAGIILPLRLLDHSGVMLYIGDSGDPWDSGQVGFIYVPQKKLEEEYGVIGCDEIKKAAEVLKGEVEEYSHYLNGEVYGYSLRNPRTHHETEATWGYYGHKWVVEDANAEADAFQHPHDAAYAKSARQMHG